MNFYVHQGSLGAELRTLSKEIKVVGIKQISILQKLENVPCEDQHYRWASSEDCSIISHTKLLLGKVLCDLSWLVVASVLKKISFCLRCVEEKLVYQMLGRDTVSTSLNKGSHIDVVNFRTESGVLVPFVSQVVIPITKIIGHVQESHEDKALLSYNVEGLRRSKRRNVQPERYLGCDNVASEINVGSFRNRPPVRIDTWKDEEDDEELHMPLACLFGLQKNLLEGDTKNHQKKASTCRELVMYNRRMAYKQKGKSVEIDQHEDQNRLAIIPIPDQDEPLLVEHCDDLDDKVTRSYGHESTEHYSKHYYLTSTSHESAARKGDKLLPFESNNHPAKSADVEKNDDLSLRYHHSYGVRKSQRKKSLSGLDDIVDLGNKWEGMRPNKGVQRKKYYASSYSRSRDHGEERRYNYKDRTLNAAAYKDLINSYLKNINTGPAQEEPSITEQWKENIATSSNGKKIETEMLNEEDGEELSEIDMLWKEMEVSLASCYLEEVCDHFTFSFPNLFYFFLD